MGSDIIADADRDAIARRLSVVVQSVIRHRTGGRMGGMYDEMGELAGEIGCSASTVAKLYGWQGYLSTSSRGRSRTPRSQYHKPWLPRLDVVVKLCQVSGVSADWLLFGRGKPPRWYTPTAQEAA